MPRRSRGDVIVLALAAALAAAPTVVQTAELDLSPIKQASADAVMSRSLVMSADAVMSRSLVMNPLSRAEVMPASAHDSDSRVQLTPCLQLLDAKKVQVSRIKDALEAQYVNFAKDLDGDNNQVTKAKCFPGTTGKSINGCGNSLPAALNPTCDPMLGFTQGCECRGKHFVDQVAVKALDPVLDAESSEKAATVACFSANENMTKAYKTASSGDFTNKLMYFGSVDGVISYYPGVLWTRPADNSGTCDSGYDPRKRSWFLSASNGPRNVILILDSSGSMQQPIHHSRMQLLKTAAKALVDGLTMSDFVAVVDFDSEAKTYEGNKFWSRAASGFRDTLKDFIDSLQADGGTEYLKAFEKAFEVADTGYASNYGSGCQTVFVFLTDGQNSGQSPVAAIKARQRRMTAENKKEMYFVIALGDDVVQDVSTGGAIKSLACDVGAVIETVKDPASSGAADVKRAEANLFNALAGFSRYFQASNAILKRDVVTFAEVYTGRNVQTSLTTAAVPIYDKRNPSRWKLLGVAGIDLTTCDLMKDVYDKNPSIQDCPAWPRESVMTKSDGTPCLCAESYTYKSKTYSGCITEAWPNPWCATVGCGIQLDSTSTGFWADCKPFGVKATLDAELMKSGEECKTDEISTVQIDALRPEGIRCLAGGQKSDVDIEAKNNHNGGIPGWKDGDITSNADWAMNADETWSAKAQTDWSTNTNGSNRCNEIIHLPVQRARAHTHTQTHTHTGCDQCSEKMQPNCAVPDTCPNNPNAAIKPLCDSEQEGGGGGWGGAMQQ